MECKHASVIMYTSWYFYSITSRSTEYRTGECVVDSLVISPGMIFFRRKKDSLYAILKRKYNFSGDSKPRSMEYEANPVPLSYLTCCWMGIKVAYIRSQIVCLQINQVYAIVTKWQIMWIISNKMLWKNRSNIYTSFHICLFGKNMTRKLQQEGILSGFFYVSSSENELKFCDVSLLLLKIDADCCINK